MADLQYDLDAPSHLAGAYDAIARIYDDHVPDTAWMRGELRRHYLDIFPPWAHLLDVGCGTGTEAIFLARRSRYVTALDISPAMIAETQRKAAVLGLTGRLETRAADLRDLRYWPEQSYDGIISTFAALNMVSSLTDFSQDAARLLRPGGRMLLHLSNRFSLQECLHLAARGKWRAARRLSREGVRPFTMAGRPMTIYLSSPSETYDWFFAPDFELVTTYALGVIRPHADRAYLPAPVLAALGQLERAVRSHRPFVGWGRFFVLDLIRRG